MKVLNIVGARPNFMKVAPIHLALRAHGHDAKLIHTGQHYDANMSQIFFGQLGMPEPDTNLGTGSGSHAIQTARVMEAFEPLLLKEKPDLVLVAGDVNSTIACALVAVKLHIPVAHLEAGLRSFDRRMPEEINRLLTDQISDVLLTPSEDANANLTREGIAKHKICFVGNAMIDSLHMHLSAAKATGAVEKMGLTPKGYGLITLHRAENVDHAQKLEALLQSFVELAQGFPLVFPMHPRTKRRITDGGFEPLLKKPKQLFITQPAGYLEFLALETAAKFVATDSGGIQEETTALGVPCLTLRDSTERPITVTEGTNTIVGTNPSDFLSTAHDIISHGGKTGKVPPFWDGGTAKRVVQALEKWKQ